LATGRTTTQRPNKRVSLTESAYEPPAAADNSYQLDERRQVRVP